MRKAFYLLLVLLSACKASEQVIEYTYLSENGTKFYYNWDDKNKPLLIIIPSLHESKLQVEDIDYLTKKFRVALLPYISNDDVNRQSQLDNISLREQLYSDLLTEITFNTGDTVFTLIAEGLNANVASHISDTYNPKKVILVNAWYPTINQALIRQCYVEKGTACDSILDYLRIGSKTDLDTFVDALKVGSSDNIYGNHNLLFWKTIVEYDALPKNHGYTGKTQYLFTQDVGLVNVSKAKHIIISSSADFEETLLSTIRN